jgi:glycosyltransferase 2 family protein
MNSKLVSFIKYFLLLVIAFALLTLAFRGISIKKIIHGIFQANLLPVLLSGIFSIAAFISRAYRWKLLIEPLGYTPTLKKTTYALMIGYLANLALPRLGEISRCGALSKSETIPFNKLLGTVIVERIIDVICLLGCMLLTAALEYKRLGNFFTENVFNPIISKFKQLLQSPLLITIAILFLVAVIAVVIYFIRKNKSKGNESTVSKLVKGFIDGLKSVMTLKRPWTFIFHSVFIWVLYYFGVYVALFTFPSTSGLGAGAALFLLVAGGLGMSAPVQGGIGPYHLLVSQGLILYGLSREEGLTFATMLHSLQLVLIIVFGIVSLLLLASVRKKNQNNPVS